MTKAETKAAAAETLPAPEANITKSEFVQASREIKARADEARWLIRLSDILAEIGELDVVFKQRKAAVEELQRREVEFATALEEAQAKAQRLVAEAKVSAEGLTASLGEKRANLETELARLQGMIDERNQQFAEADRRLRDTRATIAKLARSLPVEEEQGRADGIR